MRLEASIDSFSIYSVQKLFMIKVVNFLKHIVFVHKYDKT